MVDITLKDYDGIDRTYEDIDQVILDTADGEEKIFSLGDVSTKEVDLYMADGDQTITPDDGYLLSQVVVIKPENLKAEYIAKGINIAGIDGKFEGGEGVTKTIFLDLVDGDQTVDADENTLMQQVIIQKPTDLIPENIISGASIAGVNGAYEAPKLNAPTAISALTTASNGLQYTTVTNPSTNGNFAEKVQLLAQYTDSEDITVVAEKAVSQTSSTVSIYASDFTLQGGILLNNFRARFVGTGFTPSDEYSTSTFYSLMYMNYDLNGATISPQYKRAFLNDSLKMTLAASDGYYLPKSISLLESDGTESDNIYTYDYDTGTVTITISSANNDNTLSLVVDAVQTPWLRNLDVDVDASTMSVEFLDSNAEITPVSYNDEVLFNIVDDREGMIDYEVTTRSDGATYGFTLGTDGYYIDSTSGGTGRVAIGRILFDMKTESTVTLYFVNMGYSSTTYGIISNVDCALSTSYTTDIDTTSSNVYTTFKSSNSAGVKAVTMTIPEGKHFICIKFRRSTSSSSYYFKFKVNTQPAEYTQYDLLNYLSYGNYSLDIQSIADGYASSDIVSVNATLTPEITITDGVLSFTNPVPSDINAFDIYFDGTCQGTFAYVHGEENAINLSDFVSNTEKTYNIYVCAVGVDETYGKSNVVNAWAGSIDTASVYGVSGLYSSATALTRTDDATTMTYTINDDGTIDSDFNNVFPWTDTKLVADDDGNEFVMFPTMYFRVGADSSKRITDIAVSALPHDDGTWYKVDPFCYGRYGTVLSDDLSTTESKRGKNRAKSYPRYLYRTAMATKGENYHQLDLYHYTVLMFLWWIEWANKNSQSIMTGCVSGAGTTGGTSYMMTGGTDGLTTPSGYELTRHQMRYHYIEDFVGNQSEWIDGVYMNVGTGTYDYATSDPSKFSDTTTGLNKLSYPATASGSYNIAAFGWDSNNPFLCTPCAVSSNTSYNTYFCGKIYRYSGYTNLRVGACAPYASAGDGATFYYGSGTSATAAYIGGRMMYRGQLTPIPANIEQTLDRTELTVNGFYTITQNDDSLEVT